MGGVAAWSEALFAGIVAAGLVALTVWGVALQRLCARAEARHPDWFAALRARSRKKAARVAVTSELQRALLAGEAVPPAVRADPVAARWLRAEAWSRRLFVPLALAGFAVFALA